MYALTKEEGGRHTPFAADYRPLFYFHPPTCPVAWTWAPGTWSCPATPLVR
ncbi:hypothetical protein OHQ88_03965 [Micromonospora zamorensis]|uniref:Translation elongation factor EFTu/EF1A C-terminal domain-containing protein n=1 Tax=Micromonospora zamorensis TaxID=709883 RepID=A0ABZ1PQG7_9ACTN